MKKVLYFHISIFVWIILSAHSLKPDNQKAIVCFKNSDCDYMILCLEDTDYSVVEDFYDNCEDGDILSGDFKSYGFQDVYNHSRELTVTIYIEDWEYTEDSAIEEYNEQCE